MTGREALLWSQTWAFLAVSRVAPPPALLALGLAEAAASGCTRFQKQRRPTPKMAAFSTGGPVLSMRHGTTTLARQSRQSSFSGFVFGTSEPLNTPILTYDVFNGGYPEGEVSCQSACKACCATSTVLGAPCKGRDLSRGAEGKTDRGQRLAGSFQVRAVRVLFLLLLRNSADNVVPFSTCRDAIWQTRTSHTIFLWTL